jgi:NitT/TauT family transport system substrate-binding protein
MHLPDNRFTLSRRALLGAAGAALIAAQANPLFAQTATKIIVAPLSPPDVVTLYYGQQQGVFAKAGLDLEVTPMQSGSAAMAAVAGGAAQIAYGNILSLCQAHLRGIPLKLIAPGATYNNRFADAKLLIASDSTIKTPKDLAGGTIGVSSLHNLMTVAVAGWLDSIGVDVNGVKYVELSPGSMEAALQAKRVDAIAIYEPFLSDAVARGAKPIGTPYDSIAKQFMVTGWFTAEPWANAHRPAVLAFASALNRMSRYTNTSYKDLIPLISGFTKIQSETLLKMNFPYTPPTLAEAPIQPVIEAAAKYHEIAAAFPAKDLIFAGVL